MLRRQLPFALLVALAATAALAAPSSHGQNVDRIETVVASGLSAPSDVASQLTGGFLVADTANNLIRGFSPAGGLTSSFPGPAADLTLAGPRGVAALPDGGFLVADTGNHVIRRVSPEGIATIVAGIPGSAGSGGDGGPPTSAQLNAPQGVAPLADGAFLIADTGNNRIRRVDDGVITTVAGTGAAVFNGDGTRATRVGLNAPARVVALAGGGFLIADTGNNRIRRVDTMATITTVAGTGAPGFAGDGGPATAAQLNAPQGVAVRADGSLVVADTGNNRIRQIGADGVIRTIAGTGVAGFAGDGGLPAAALLSAPRAVAQGLGRLLVADTGNDRIRSVATVTPQPDPIVPQTLPEPAPQAPPGVAPPALGRNAVVAPVAGTVRVKLAGRRGFVELTEAQNVGVGSVLDTTRGAVAVFFTTSAQGRAASAVAARGRFQLLQPNVRVRGQRPGLLSLRGRLTCPKSAGAQVRLADPATASAAARKRKPKRRLRVSARGAIRTKGRYAAAIVRGTEWTTQDQCPPLRPVGTKFTVTEGVIAVRDFVRHRTVRVAAGERYVARARIR